MISGNSAAETITSDPVIVEVPDIEKLEIKTPLEEEVNASQTRQNPDPLPVDIHITRGRTGGPPPPPPPANNRIIYPERRYSRSRSPVYHISNHRNSYTALLSNTSSLNSIIASGDETVETVKGRLVYITSHEFHTADLQKFNWLFQFGVQDNWVQTPTAYLPGNVIQFNAPRGRARNEYFDDEFDRYDVGPRGAPVAMAKLGAAFKIFGEDGKGEGVEKVKFLVVLNSKNDAGWVRLLVCYSRQAAASEICLALLNSHSVAFVGAVLQTVSIPAENPNKKARELVRVASVEEAEKVDQGVIGVIC